MSDDALARLILAAAAACLLLIGIGLLGAVVRAHRPEEFD